VDEKTQEQYDRESGDFHDVGFLFVSLFSGKKVLFLLLNQFKMRRPV